jgi:hypothetical protein
MAMISEGHLEDHCGNICEGVSGRCLHIKHLNKIELTVWYVSLVSSGV